jgi:hypothetical protein
MARLAKNMPPNLPKVSPLKVFQTGDISVSIWPPNENGHRDATIRNRYYDKRSHEWKATSQFTAGDLIILAALAQEAAMWIIREESSI